jgi:hypothetical protein
MLPASAVRAPTSMKRTNLVFAVLLPFAVLGAWAQEAGKAAPVPPQADPIDEIVAAMRAAEQRAKSFRIELSTTGQMPGGLELSTKGTLHVLRGAQPALHSLFEFRFADGLGGRMESAQTSTGVVLFEDDPAFGELFLHVDPTTVADLEWAGVVLERADLPGMADSRAVAPLGSSMVADLRRQFTLAALGKKERNGEAGTWLGGPRRAGLDDQDPDLPLADRVELFVRTADRALLEVRHLQGEKVLQHLVVASVQVDLEIPAKVFTVDGRGQRLREVQQHLPMWDQIEQLLQRAEAKAAEGRKEGEPSAEPVVRPSRR